MNCQTPSGWQRKEPEAVSESVLTHGIVVEVRLQLLTFGTELTVKSVMEIKVSGPVDYSQDRSLTV